MRFDEKELQKLKEKKTSIENLNDQYFVHFKLQYNGIYIDGDAGIEVELEVENILKLLNENICSFQ